jgi:hypothetical protein
MPTTTNYGWTTPADTDLVKDGASAIRTLGTAIDTTTKNLNPSTTLGDIEYRSSTANTNTRLPLGTARQVLQVNSGATAPEWAASPQSVLTTAGDSLYASSANTMARLGIGTAGQVLTVNSGATAPEWKTLSAGANWSLLNSGGTALTGATSITVSGISGADKIAVRIKSASSANASSFISLRFNSDTGANYTYNGADWNVGSTYSVNIAGNTAWDYDGSDQIYVGLMSSSAASKVNGFLTLTGGNTTALKIFNYVGQGHADGGNSHATYVAGGIYSGSSTISSVTVISSTGNFDNGSIFVYTSA